MPTQRQTTGLEAEAWARRSARMLRRTHASFAVAGVGDREGFLEDQIKEALVEAGAVSPEARTALLEKLGQCFSREIEGFTPALGSSGPTTSQSKAPEQVRSIWRDASEETRRLIIEELMNESPELAKRVSSTRSPILQKKVLSWCVGAQS